MGLSQLLAIARTGKDRDPQREKRPNLRRRGGGLSEATLALVSRGAGIHWLLQMRTYHINGLIQGDLYMDLGTKQHRA